MSASISQLNHEGLNFEHAVKNTFLHFKDAPHKLRRSFTAPPELTTCADDNAESSNGETWPCSSHADSGISISECSSPRDWQEPIQSPMISPTVPTGYVFVPVLVLSCFIPSQPLGRKEASVEEKVASHDSEVENPQSHAKEMKEACHHIWRLDPKKFWSTKPKVTQKESFPLGEFAFTIHAQEVHQSRGGSSFATSEGRGTINVKCNSVDVGERVVTVTVGDESDTAIHNFSTDPICKIPRVFDFKGDKKGEIAVVFSL